MSFDLDADSARKYNLKITYTICTTAVMAIAIISAYLYFSEKLMLENGYFKVAVPRVSSYEYQWVKPGAPIMAPIAKEKGEL